MNDKYHLTLSDVTIVLEPENGDYITIRQPEGEDPTTIVFLPELTVLLDEAPEDVHVQYTGPVTVNMTQSESDLAFEHRQLQALYGDLFAEHQGYRAQVTELRFRHDMLRRENAHLEADNDALTREVSSLKAEIVAVDECWDHALDQALEAASYEKDRAVQDLNEQLADALADVETLSDAYVELLFRDFTARLFTGMDAPAEDYECPPLFPAPFGVDSEPRLTFVDGPASTIDEHWFSDARQYLQQAMERRS